MSWRAVCDCLDMAIPTLQSGDVCFDADIGILSPGLCY